MPDLHSRTLRAPARSTALCQHSLALQLQSAALRPLTRSGGRVEELYVIVLDPDPTEADGLCVFSMHAGGVGTRPFSVALVEFEERFRGWASLITSHMPIKLHAPSRTNGSRLKRGRCQMHRCAMHLKVDSIPATDVR